MEEHEVVYTFRAVDEISKPLDGARRNIEATEQASKKYNKTAEEVASQSAKASASVQSLNQDQTQAILKSVETLSAMQAIQSGLSAVTSSVRTLGLVDEETAKTLQKVTAGVQLLVGTAQAVKGVVTLFNSLNSVLKTTAIVSTFASIAENPAKGALIVGGAGLAAGALAGYMYSATQNNNNTTINVQHESTARQAETLVDTGTWY